MPGSSVEADEQVLGGKVDVAVHHHRGRLSSFVDYLDRERQGSAKALGERTHMTDPTTRAGMAIP